MKRCTKCGEYKPATAECFDRRSLSKDGLFSWCKSCRARYNKERADSRKTYDANYYEHNKRAILDKKAKYYIQHRSDKLEYYYLHASEYTAYRKNNVEKIRLQKRRYRRININKIRNDKYKRRTMFFNLPYKFYYKDERHAFDYFEGKCAICNKDLDWLNRQYNWDMDHWIPISDPRPDNPGTVPENMLPMCVFCNRSKKNYDPIVWVNKKYSEEDANCILMRIKTYFYTLSV